MRIYQMLASFDARNKKAPYSWIKYLIMALLLVLAPLVGVWMSKTHQKSVAEAQQRDSSVITVHKTEQQTMTVEMGKERWAWVVAEGRLIGEYRYIPINFTDDDSDRLRLLVVPRSIKLDLNQPVWVRQDFLSDGLLGGLTESLTLVGY
ncbi:MAG: hypothetical protein QG633_432 [Patescibacteria group bacterium]|jgi:heme exporter protein D|nr:hypothetical protein [Patescibacteria group bacterium]